MKKEILQKSRFYSKIKESSQLKIKVIVNQFIT